MNTGRISLLGTACKAIYSVRLEKLILGRCLSLLHACPELYFSSLALILGLLILVDPEPDNVGRKILNPNTPTWKEKYRALRVETESNRRELEHLRRDSEYDNSRQDRIVAKLIATVEELRFKSEKYDQLQEENMILDRNFHSTKEQVLTLSGDSVKLKSQIEQARNQLGTEQARIRSVSKSVSKLESEAISRSVSPSRPKPTRRPRTPGGKVGVLTIEVLKVRKLADGCEEPRVCTDIQDLFTEFDLNSNGRIEENEAEQITQRMRQIWASGHFDDKDFSVAFEKFSSTGYDLSIDEFAYLLDSEPFSSIMPEAVTRIGDSDCSPYAVLTLGNDQQHTGAGMGWDATWAEAFSFDIYDPQDILGVAIFGKARLHPLGSAHIGIGDLTSMAPGQETKKWLSLAGSKAGELEVRMRFEPAKRDRTKRRPKSPMSPKRA